MDHVPIAASDTEQTSLACPACGSEMTALLRASNRDAQVILEKSICSNCCYIHFTRMPRPAWFERYYREIWDSSRQAPKRYDPSGDAYASNLKLLQKYNVPHSASIFDFGAGYGQFLEACRLQGYKNLYGTEASKRRADFCQKELGLPVVLSDGDMLHGHPDVATSAPYDVVHSHHVFEHVVDVNDCLAAANRILKPGGRLHLADIALDYQLSEDIRRNIDLWTG